LKIYTDEIGATPEIEHTQESFIDPVSEIQLHDPMNPNLQGILRQEAYQWPRLVFRPMKKSGHIILDSCTAEGLLFLHSK